MSDEALGYVVIEWNQASHQPDIFMADLHGSIETAEAEAELLRQNATEVGRRERYTVAAVVEIEASA